MSIWKVLLIERMPTFGGGSFFLPASSECHQLTTRINKAPIFDWMGKSAIKEGLLSRCSMQFSDLALACHPTSSSSLINYLCLALRIMSREIMRLVLFSVFSFAPLFKRETFRLPNWRHPVSVQRWPMSMLLNFRRRGLILTAAPRPPFPSLLSWKVGFLFGGL